MRGHMRLFVGCLVASCLVGCSSIHMPGSIQKPGSDPLSGFQPDGTYKLSEREQTYTCYRLDVRLEELDNDDKRLRSYAQAERTFEASTLEAAYARATSADPVDGTSASGQLQHNAAERNALKEARRNKGCKPAAE